MTLAHSRRAAQQHCSRPNIACAVLSAQLPMSQLQTKPEKKYLDQFGLDLINGAVINNVEAGVLEPALAKTKIIQVMADEQRASNLESRRAALACLSVTQTCAAASELTGGFWNCCSLQLRLQSLS